MSRDNQNLISLHLPLSIIERRHISLSSITTCHSSSSGSSSIGCPTTPRSSVPSISFQLGHDETAFRIEGCPNSTGQIGLGVKGETKSWWNPSDPSRRDRKTTDMSKIVDTGLFALDSLAPESSSLMTKTATFIDTPLPAQEDLPSPEDLPAQKDLPAQENKTERVEDIPLPDDSPTIPLSPLPHISDRSRSQGLSVHVTSVNRVRGDCSQNVTREEFWSVTRLGKRPQGVMDDYERDDHDQSILGLQTSTSSQSRSSTPTSSLKSKSSSRSAPTIPTRQSSRSLDPPVLPKRASSLNDPVHAITTLSSTSTSKHPRHVAPGYSINSTLRTHRRTVTSSTVSSLSTVFENPLDSAQGDTNVHVKTLPRLCHSQSHPIFISTADDREMIQKLRLRRGASFGGKEGSTMAGDGFTPSSGSSPSDFDTIRRRTDRTFTFRKSEKGRPSLLLDEYPGRCSTSNPRRMTVFDVPPRLDLPFTSHRPAPRSGIDVLENDANDVNDVNSSWGKSTLLAIRKEAEVALAEAQAWQWPNPPVRSPATLSTSKSDSTLGAPVTPQAPSRVLVDEDEETCSDGLTPRPIPRVDVFEEERLDVLHGEREFEAIEKKRRQSRLWGMQDCQGAIAIKAAYEGAQLGPAWTGMV